MIKEASISNGPRMKSRDEKDPGPLIWRGLLLAASAWIVSGFLIRLIFHDISGESLNQLNQATSLFAVLTGLFTGALISRAIYDYINLQSQRRNWRHEIALSRLQEIYVPLWEETMGRQEAISSFRKSDTWTPYTITVGDGQRRATIFGSITRSHLGLFLDEKAYDLLKEYDEAASAYDEAQKEAWKELYDISAKKGAELAEKLGASDSHRFSESFAQSQRIVYDESISRDSVGTKKGDYEYAHSLFLNNHKIISHSEMAAEQDFDEMLQLLRNLEGVKKVREERLKCLPKGGKVIERLKQIFTDPTEIRI